MGDSSRLQLMCGPDHVTVCEGLASAGATAMQVGLTTIIWEGLSSAGFPAWRWRGVGAVVELASAKIKRKNLEPLERLSWQHRYTGENRVVTLCRVRSRVSVSPDSGG